MPTGTLPSASRLVLVIDTFGLVTVTVAVAEGTMASHTRHHWIHEAYALIAEGAGAAIGAKQAQISLVGLLNSRGPDFFDDGSRGGQGRSRQHHRQNQDPSSHGVPFRFLA